MIIYIILNYQINKRVIRVVSFYPITNWIVFEFVIFDQFIIPIVIGITNIVLSKSYLISFFLFIPIKKEGWFFGFSWPRITHPIVLPTHLGFLPQYPI